MSVTLWLVFARAVGFFMRAPGFSRAGVPSAARAGFALALALAVAPLQSRVLVTDIAAFLTAVAGEALVGLVLGMSATLVAEAVAAAGRILDDFVGLRASVPQIAVAPPGLGGVWMLVFTTAFFALGGIDALVAAFAHSFAIVPLGAGADGELLRRTGLGFGVAFARESVELAAPAICVALCIQLGHAVLARVIPRFSHLSLAYPVAYAGVLVVAFLSLSTLRDLAAR